MSCGFTVADPLGVAVTLVHDTWVRHVQLQRHPEVEPYLGLFHNIVEHPDHILEDARGQRLYLRYGVAAPPFAESWLLLVAREAELCTWRLVPTAGIPEGRLLWPRPRF